jgi:hypothetical protein
MIRRARLVLTAAGVAFITRAAGAAMYNTTWLGGSGEWYYDYKWSLHTVPINTATDQYNAFITGDSAVWAGNGTVNSVYIGTGARMDVGVANRLTAAGGITVDGFVEMGANAVLRVGAGQAFGGNGKIDFYYGGCVVAATGGSLTIGPGLTVGTNTFPEAASGTIGEPAYPVTNYGTIASLKQFAKVTVVGQTFTNGGTLLLGADCAIDINTTLKRLSELGTVSNPGGGGSVRLVGTVDNSASSFVLDGSVPGLTVGGTIVGGTVTATGAGVLRTGTLTLDNVTLNAPAIVSGLKIRAGQTFAGNADVLLPSSGTFITADTTTGTLAIGAGLNIHGTGTVGQSGAPLVNHANLTADNPGKVLTVAGSTFTNDGTFRATNNGILAFAGTYTLASLGTVTNDGGTLRLAGTLTNTGQTFTNGSPYTFQQLAGRILGGTVNAPAGATELFVPSTTTTATLENVTYNGVLRMEPSAAATLRGTTLNGTVHLAANTTLAIPGTLSGAATLLLGGTTSLVTNSTPNASAANLVLGPGVIVRGGSGTVGPTGSYSMTSQGLIQADPGSTVTLQGLFGVTSDGILAALAGSTIKSLHSLSLGSTGTLLVELGGAPAQAALNVTGSLNLSGSDDVLDLRQVTPGVGPFLVATYTGTVTGAFDHVSPGYLVDYSTPKKIFVTALPEPGTALWSALVTIASLARRRRCRATGG